MKIFLIALVLGGVLSCASTHKNSSAPLVVLRSVCDFGVQRQKIFGTIWTKFESKDLKGQFPASVLMDSMNQKLTLEITNLLNAPQAWVTIEKNRLNLKLTDENQQGWKALESRFNKEQVFGALPTAQALRVFGGRFPCPHHFDFKESSENEQSLEFIYSNEKYEYFVTQRGSYYWAHKVRLTDLKSQKVFEFEFFDPQLDHSDVPKRWVVRELDSKAMKSDSSQSDGQTRVLQELQVRWKDFKSL